MTVKIKRNFPGDYSVGPKSDPDRWSVEKLDDHPRTKWRVLRFGTGDNKEVIEQVYTFDTYAEARDHALMEAGVTELAEVIPDKS